MALYSQALIILNGDGNIENQATTAYDAAGIGTICSIFGDRMQTFGERCVRVEKRAPRKIRRGRKLRHE
jgi:hypothetical protein